MVSLDFTSTKSSHEECYGKRSYNTHAGSSRDGLNKIGFRQAENNWEAPRSGRMGLSPFFDGCRKMPRPPARAVYNVGPFALRCDNFSGLSARILRWEFLLSVGWKKVTVEIDENEHWTTQIVTSSLRFGNFWRRTETKIIRE